MTDKTIRQLAAIRKAADREAEVVPERPEPLAATPQEGLRRMREIAATYGPHLADQASRIAFGDGTRSQHTRTLCMQILWGILQTFPESISAQAVPEPVSVQPDGGGED